MSPPLTEDSSTLTPRQVQFVDFVPPTNLSRWFAMNRWDDLVGEPLAGVLRQILTKAASIAHTENGARFDPDDLGDDALIYGLCTTNSARHVASRLVEDEGIEGVAVCERGRVWWLEVQRGDETAVRVFFYKAPPGAHNIHGLRLDDAEIKRDLSTSNGHQIALFNRSGGNGNVDLLNVIVVHFGGPEQGLEKLEVGAPYLHEGAIAWDWHEYFDTVEAARPPARPLLGDDEAGFPGLRLVKDDDTRDANGRPAEQATSEFEALELRGEAAEEDSHADGQESS